MSDFIEWLKIRNSDFLKNKPLKEQYGGRAGYPAGTKIPDTYPAPKEPSKPPLIGDKLPEFEYGRPTPSGMIRKGPPVRKYLGYSSSEENEEEERRIFFQYKPIDTSYIQNLAIKKSATRGSEYLRKAYNAFAYISRDYWGKGWFPDPKSYFGSFFAGEDIRKLVNSQTEDFNEVSRDEGWIVYKGTYYRPRNSAELNEMLIALEELKEESKLKVKDLDKMIELKNNKNAKAARDSFSPNNIKPKTISDLEKEYEVDPNQPMWHHLLPHLSNSELYKRYQILKDELTTAIAIKNKKSIEEISDDMRVLEKHIRNKIPSLAKQIQDDLRYALKIPIFSDNAPSTGGSLPNLPNKPNLTPIKPVP